MSFSYKAKIPGQLPSMKNSKRIVKNFKTGKPMVIKKQSALDWEERAMYSLTRPMKPHEGEVALVGVFYYNTKLSDLDENLLMDILEKRGVIKNDRQVKGKLTRWELDKENPRVEFELMDMELFHELTDEIYEG